MNITTTTDSSDFSNLGISPKLLSTIAKRRFRKPTHIQTQAIPIGLADRDIVALSGPGTGRTLAFGIPMIQNIARRKGVGWVVVPFAGLAAHVEAILQKVGREAGLRTVILKESLTDSQIQRQLARRPHIIIGQPDQFIRGLEGKRLDPDKVKVLVCDEAERLFEPRYADHMERLITAVPADRQLLAFFSVASQQGEAALARHSHDPAVIKTDPAASPVRRRWPAAGRRDRRPSRPPIRSAKETSSLELEFAEFRPAKHYGSLGSSALTNTHKLRPSSSDKPRR